MKRKILFIVVFFSVLIRLVPASEAESKLQSLCDSLLAPLPGLSLHSRALVLPFADKTGKNNVSLGAGLAEFLVVKLQESGKLTIVDRSEFQRVLEEIDLGQSDLVDGGTVLNAGTIVSAEYIIAGSIIEVFGKLRVNAKIISTKTTEIVTTASVVIASKDLEMLTKEMLGEKMNVSSAMFRSLLIPGWGQFYTGHYVRGSIGLTASFALLGTTVYSIIRTRNARIDRTEHDNYYHSSEFKQKLSDGCPECIGWYNGESDRLNRGYEDWFDRAVLLGSLTGLSWGLNLLDAAIAGTQSKRKLELYFSTQVDSKNKPGIAVNLCF